MSAKLAELKKELGGIPSEDFPERAHVLIVDDENGPRQALRMLLKEDYEVHLASDVVSALELVDSQPVDVIITDIRMPRQTGVDLLRQVKERLPDVQVIILTGYGQLETAMKAVEYGAFAYMEKPFDNDIMLRQVQAALSRRTRDLERRRLEQLALEANRFDIVGRVVSGMLHDLGTPLSVIGSHLELMIYGIDQSDIENRLAVMHEQVMHCTDIVRSTMGFLRHQSQKPVPLNLNDVVKTCLDLAGPLMRRQHVALVETLAPELPLCKGDFILIRQAILNLITNACQAMQSQTEPQEIHIHTRAEDGQVLLSVGDTGPGIPPQNRRKVFDTFFSTKSKSGGTGLGLAVVRNVMRQHGGDITVTDNGPRGALFTMHFPVADEEPAPDSAG